MSVPDEQKQKKIREKIDYGYPTAPVHHGRPTYLWTYELCSYGGELRNVVNCHKAPEIDSIMSYFFYTHLKQHQ